MPKVEVIINILLLFACFLIYLFACITIEPNEMRENESRHQAKRNLFFLSLSLSLYFSLSIYINIYARFFFSPYPYQYDYIVELQ